MHKINTKFNPCMNTCENNIARLCEQDRATAVWKDLCSRVPRTDVLIGFTFDNKESVNISNLHFQM